MATGHYRFAERILLVTGRDDDPRFWTVLRHEAAHAVLHDTLPDNLYFPFWLDEGVASWLEQGAGGRAGKNKERLRLLRYLFGKDEPLDFKNLLNTTTPPKKTGATYAHSWGLVACLVAQNRPLQRYFDGLRKKEDRPKHLFRKYLLRPGETIEHFELSCSKWILSQTIGP